MKFPSTSNTIEEQVLQPLTSPDCTLFLLPLFFKEYLNPQVKITKIANIVSITTLVLQDQPQEQILSYFIDPFELYLSSKILLNFLLKLPIPQLLGEIFTSIVFRFSRKWTCESKKLKLEIFTHVIFRQNLSPKFLSSPPVRRNLHLQEYFYD